MLTTVPFKSVPGLDAPVTHVMHHGVVALPASATLADAAGAMRDNKVHAVLITGSDASPHRVGERRSGCHAGGRLRDRRDGARVRGPVQGVVVQDAAARDPAELTVFIATGASHILVAASAAETPVGVIGESDLVAFMAA